MVIAPRPLERHAEAATDFKMRTKISSYSRRKRIFSGVSPKGTIINTDNKSDYQCYGQKISSKKILIQEKIKQSPQSAHSFIKKLNKMFSSVKEKFKPIYLKITDLKIKSSGYLFYPIF